MEIQTIKAGSLSTISWVGDNIIDWAKTTTYLANGTVKQGGTYYSFGFDAAITSADGQYAFIYKRLGTKGLLLKDGEELREINRSYYCADAYEYPAAFVTVDGVTYLIHCPLEYCRIDFENVETGELVTDIPGREPADVFHSRFEISPGSKYLMSKGWVWHPLDVVYAFNITECLNNPLLLDQWHLYDEHTAEICTASFIDDELVLLGASDESINDEATGFLKNHIAIWNILTRTIESKAKVDVEFGNLFAINADFAWDTVGHPKIINIKTGEVVDRQEDFDSGDQRSSIISDSNTPPQIVFKRHTKQLAITDKEGITILTPSPQYRQ
ncbi:hypothetical protein [Mucilaginibacter gynuensis]